MMSRAEKCRPLKWVPAHQQDDKFITTDYLQHSADKSELYIFNLLIFI